ncbi:energy coupling factor transporter S component ThiW [Halocella sp. SP3-1]|uniref:energy coupling factor transporter S component ThiW n=1 Tax=Halocella sp. SP3-1 TaxID=2382161 RepID=UPI00197ABC98|nr:energy coupling factor transporter S component ThiW [Halocella sp. SP3-1]
MKVSTKKVAFVGLFIALEVVLSGTSIPVGATKIMPLQHTLNATAGILLGPWYAVVAGFFTAVMRVSLGTGTIFAFPGSVFGGLVVGYFYKIGKKDYAAFTEPLGTALIGGTLSALLFAPVINAEGSIWFFIYLFALSSVPGGIIGYFFVKLIRNVLPNINWEEL